MSEYRNILVAAEDSSMDHETVHQACNVAEHSGGRVHVLHAIPSMGTMAYTLPSFVAINAERYQEAQEMLALYGHEYHIPESERWVAEGEPVSVILDKARDVSADLIVLGHHHEHFFGGVAEGVLGRAECDILVVRS